MAIHDEIREQQKKMKGKSFQDKLEYFWDYYKVHTLAAIFIVVLAVIFVRDIATAKDEAFSATLLNAYGGERQSEFQNSFTEFAGIDTEVYECYIDTSSTLSSNMSSESDLAIFQRTIAMSQTAGLDILMADLPSFNRFATNGMFLDLRSILTDEEYARYEPCFYYIDDAARDNDSYDEVLDALDGVADIHETDHTDPSAMEDPVPVGIYLPDSAKLKEFGCYTLTGETPIFGFVFSTERLDTARQFLHYLTE